MKIVIKIGTNVLTKQNKIDSFLIKKLAAEIAPLVRKKDRIVIVSSGAIGLGSMRLNIKKRSRDIKTKQSLASIGQRILMNEYGEAFQKHKIEVAQILLTYPIISERKTYLNIRNCLNTLLKMGVVPIINENDVVSTDEIDSRFGDNDRLSAIVASKLDADLLILLTDIDGLYTDNPKKNRSARKISVVEKITPEIEKYAGKSGSAFAIGGMRSKINAAKIATEAGCKVVIANGREKNIIKKVINKEPIGTSFLEKQKMSSKKRWIMYASPKGKVQVNTRAKDVLKKGRSSLLPIGIESIEGDFKKGDVVWIGDFAKGIVDFDADQIKKKIDSSAKSKEVIKKENMILIR